MVDTCTDFYGSLPAVPTSIILMLAFSIFCGCCRLLVYYIENFDKPPENPFDAKDTSYGLGAKVPVKMMSSLSLALSLPTVLLWFIFSNVDGFAAKQFACQVQSGTPYIFPAILTYTMFLILCTNYMRKFTRFSFARIVDEYLTPANTDLEADGDEVLRIANMPAYRGVWVGPFAQAFEANCKARGVPQERIELVTMDCFESVYNAEDSKWLKANMAAEGLAHLNILWTNFVSLPLDDASVDVFMYPLGTVNAYLNGVPGEECTPEMKRMLTVGLVREITRVLKPNGVLIASNMSMFGAHWAEALTEVGLESTVLPNKVWWSYMPATVTVARKTPATIAAMTTAAAAAARSKGGDAVTISALHTSHAAADAVIETAVSETVNARTAGGTMASLEVERQARFSTSVGPLHELSVHGCWPPGAHWTKVQILLAVSCCAYVGFVVLTWQLLPALQVPYVLPYDQMVSALFVSNAVFLPVAMYGMLGELRRAAAYVDSVEAGGGSAAGALVDGDSIIMKTYRKQLVNVLVILTLSTFLGWLPYFSLDVFLINVCNFEVDEVTDVNLYVTIGVIAIFIPTCKWLYGMYQKREAEEERERRRGEEDAAAWLSAAAQSGPTAELSNQA